VVDVTEFAASHPGGHFLLDKCIGTDISKFFYGGYSLESANKGGVSHAHSNYAKTIVSGLVLGKYTKNITTSESL
jgi:cytochrome b involved in lipid metabolism